MKREQKKLNSIVDELKDELKRERRNYQKMDIINSKILSDLADTKLSTKQLIDDYQKERKARELLEEICDELVKEIEDIKARVKSMEIEYSRIQEEVVEEWKMLQMSEVQCEEWVQMKLVDAKLILEEKYYQMNNLIGDLETFLSSRDASLDMSQMTEAMRIKQAMDAMNVQDIKELRYTPPRSYDIYTIMEELRSSGANESEIDQCLRPSPASHSSKIQNDSPKANEFTEISNYGHSSNYIDCDRSSGNGGLRETVNHSEDQQSSYSFSSSAYFVNGTGGVRHKSGVVTCPDQNENQEPLNSSTDKISSEQHFKNKGSSLHKLWRSSLSSDGVCKSAADSSENAISPENALGEGALNQHELVPEWCSPGHRNPHIARATRGCIGWSQGIQRYSLKAKLLEASLEIQKTQVCNVLEPRIR